MSKEFIESGINKASITNAAIQQDQLLYFTTSKLESNTLDTNLLQNWVERKYQGNDYFLNWVKKIFKTDNFIQFYKYLRFPLPSAKIIHNKIEPQLKRVFNAEDSEFKYDVKNKTEADFIEDLNIKQFNNDIFFQLLYYHNSLLVTELDPEIENKPYNYYLNIDDVVSLDYKKEKYPIKRIAFKGSIIFEEKKINGYIYIDSSVYAFYNSDRVLITSKPHDLKHTPVHFISDKPFLNDNIIKESLFTFIREELEEYCFLKTLQKMTDSNGAFPVVTKLKADEIIEDIRGSNVVESSDYIMGSQKESVYNKDKNSTGDLQAGTIHEVPISSITDDEGRINVDAVKNYLNLIYIPGAVLDYINKRIGEIERSIESTIVGDVLESNEASKNRDQIAKSISILENTLNSIAGTLNRIRKLRDTDWLGLKYGIDLVQQIFIHYGTDFFLDSRTQLFEDLEKAPNQLERKTIIARINQNRYKNNNEILTRQKLLYDLIPYVSDKDFSLAGDIDPVIKDYQLRFNYWISQFEALYGNIVYFYSEHEGTQSEKIKLINNLILTLIKENENSRAFKRSNILENS